MKEIPRWWTDVQIIKWNKEQTKQGNATGLVTAMALARLPKKYVTGNVHVNEEFRGIR